jgi:hypothetical protein
VVFVLLIGVFVVVVVDGEVLPYRSLVPARDPRLEVVNGRLLVVVREIGVAVCDDEDVFGTIGSLGTVGVAVAGSRPLVRVGTEIALLALLVSATEVLEEIWSVVLGSVVAEGARNAGFGALVWLILLKQARPSMAPTCTGVHSARLVPPKAT